MIPGIASRRWRILAPAFLASAAMVLSACTSSGGSATAQSDPNRPLLVWTDATRQPGFEQFKKAHPNVKMKIETYDTSALLTKIQLFNRTGKGHPDVVFSPLPTHAASLSSKLFDFAEPLDSLVPASVQRGFGSANDTCKIDGKLVCLKNDLAQSVLWYNKPLMKQWGYEIPTTWEEYAALGRRVARDHPGTIIGSAGSQFVYYDFLYSSGCPLQTVTRPGAVHINTKDPKCTRVTKLLDPMIKSGVVSRHGPFDPEMSKLSKEGKILMMPGASWYGDFVFKPAASFATPKGKIAAAPYPKWQGESKSYSGATGGGIYVVSKRSANEKGAVAVAQWMATSTKYQANAPTYPAYGPAAKAWGAKHAGDTFYAADPFPVLQKQAGLINPAEKPTVYEVDAAITSTLVAKVRAGGKLADGMTDLQTQLSQLAQSTGYTVN